LSSTLRDLATEIPPRDSIAVRVQRDFGSFARESLRASPKWKVAVSAEVAETASAWLLLVGDCTVDATAALHVCPTKVSVERRELGLCQNSVRAMTLR
jgi:hypothetical protein